MIVDPNRDSLVIPKVPPSKITFNLTCNSLNSSTDNVLCAELTFALVKAKGKSVKRQTSLINSWSGILMPTKSDPGLSSQFKVSLLLKQSVTGPGNSWCNNSSEILTWPHLLRSLISPTQMESGLEKFLPENFNNIDS